MTGVTLKRATLGIGDNGTNTVGQPLRGSVRFVEPAPRSNAEAPGHRSMAPPTVLHDDLREIAFLLGMWTGVGDGVWPPGEPFTFGEDMTFEHAGEPYLLYAQRSWSLDDGGAIHFERGFLRPAGRGRVELVLAHPIGVAEVAVGTVEDGVVTLASTAVSLTPTAEPVIDLRRRIEVRGDELAYELYMAMEGVDLASHVRSRLKRT